MLTSQLSLLDLIEVPLDKDTLTIDSGKDFTDFYKHCLNIDKIALDIETSGRGLNPFKGKVRLLSFSDGSGTCGVIDKTRSPNLYHQLLKSHLYRPYTDINHEVLIHDANFELGFWAVEGYRNVTTRIWDTMTANGLLTGGTYESNTLAAVVKKTLLVKLDKELQASDWGKNPLTNEQINYSAIDVRYLHRVREVQRGDLRDYRGLLPIFSLEMEFIKVIAEMQANGFWVNKQEFDLQSSSAEQLYNDKLKEWQKYSGGISFHDSKELKNWIREQGIPVPTKISPTTGKEIETTDDAHLAELNYPQIEVVRDLRTLHKAAITIKSIRESLDYDGRIHGDFTSLSPKGTGRSTCRAFSDEHQLDPSTKSSTWGVNLQQIPKVFPGGGVVRKSFQPDKGNVFLIIDFPACHTKVAAQIIKPKLVLANYNEGLEMHCITASAIARNLGKEKTLWDNEELNRLRKLDLDSPDDPQYTLSKLAGKLRDVAKNCFYLYQNGGGKKKTYSTLADLNPTEEGAFAFYDELVTLFPEIKEWHSTVARIDPNRVKRFNGKKYQFYKTLCGRISWLPVLPPNPEYTWSQEQCNLNQACMANWMGVESTMKKMSAVIIHRKFLENPQWEAKLIHDNHDELVSEVKEEYAKEISKFIYDTVEEVGKKYITVIPWMEGYKHKSYTYWAK